MSSPSKPSLLDSFGESSFGDVGSNPSAWQGFGERSCGTCGVGETPAAQPSVAPPAAPSNVVETVATVVVGLGSLFGIGWMAKKMADRRNSG